MRDSRGRVWTGVLRVAPHQGAHRAALRAAVSITVPLLVVWALGRLDLSIYASFGAFAALYGRHDPYRDRIRMQAAAGAVMVAAMLCGTSLSFIGAPAIVSVAVVAAIASGVTLLSYRMQWHPPGPLFPVFAAGACVTIPATASTFAAVIGVAGLSVLFSLAVTSVIALALRRPPAIDRKARLPVGRVAGEMTLTVGAATLAAGIAALLIVESHWYWAMVGAVAAVSGARTSARVIRGIQRLLGTLLGVIVAAAILGLGLPPLAVIAIAALLQTAAELFVGRNYGIAMVFITPLALLMVSLAAPTPADVLLRDRVIDTIIGVAIGTAVAVASAAIRRRRGTAD